MHAVEPAGAERSIGEEPMDIVPAVSREGAGTCSRQCMATVKPRANSASRAGAIFTFIGIRVHGRKSAPDRCFQVASPSAGWSRTVTA